MPMNGTEFVKERERENLKLNGIETVIHKHRQIWIVGEYKDQMRMNDHSHVQYSKQKEYNIIKKIHDKLKRRKLTFNMRSNSN